MKYLVEFCVNPETAKRFLENGWELVTIQAGVIQGGTWVFRTPAPPEYEVYPCPFCGAEPTVDDGKNCRISCDNVGCPAETMVVQNSRAEALAAWNDRAKI